MTIERKEAHLLRHDCKIRAVTTPIAAAINGKWRIVLIIFIGHTLRGSARSFQIVVGNRRYRKLTMLMQRRSALIPLMSGNAISHQLLEFGSQSNG
jgi:hypothetical protein